MGLYLNPGNEAYKISRYDDIYIDKSDMIDFVNSRIGKRKRYLCVSRPRRFGKSVTAEMLTAYYDLSVDSSALFSDLKIAKCESYHEHLNRYHVIYLNVQQLIRNLDKIEELTKKIEEQILKELEKKFDLSDNQFETLANALSYIYSIQKEKEKGFIFIIDEWDCVFRIAKDMHEVQEDYLDFLRDLFKDRVYVKLAYMTGILPIKKYGTHSALNIFDEYTMTNPMQLGKYVGFTEQEVKELCDQYHMDYEDAKKWYNGYCFRDNIPIYNPKSIVDAMENQQYTSYWTSTETYEALQVYIDRNIDGLKEALTAIIGGESYKIDTGTFQNDMTTFKCKDDILTLLVHLGYLAYDDNTKAVSIPNEEIRLEFVRAIKNGVHSELADRIVLSEKLYMDTINGDEKSVAKTIDEVHEFWTTPMFYNNEQALRSVIRFAYIYCIDEYKEIQEMPSGHGYADIVYIPRKGSNKPAMVIELKWNKTKEGAISQIREKGYHKVLEGMLQNQELILVGINYDEKTKKHTCKIEKMR